MRDGWIQGQQDARKGLPASVYTRIHARRYKPPTPEESAKAVREHEGAIRPQTAAPESPGGDTKEETPVAGIQSDEAITIPALRQEMGKVVSETEVIREYMRRQCEYLAQLGERYAGAELGTKNLTAAISALTDSQGAMQAALKGCDEIQEGVTAVNRAIDEAESLGEQAAAIQAEGNVQSFQPA